MKLHIEVGAKSVPGKGRHPYQDRFLDGTDSKNPRLLFAVADGVTHSRPWQSDGGVAAEAMMNLLRDSDPSLSLSRAVLESHGKLLEMKKYLPYTIGETTIVAAKITGNRIEVVNVGDSPAHLLRKERMRRLYRPDLGFFGGITQTLGYDSKIRLHKRSATLLPGDIIILGSDGLVKSIRSLISWSEENSGKYITRSILGSNELREIVNGSKYMAIAAEEIVKAVQEKMPQMFDDITVIAIRAIRKE